MNREEAIAEIRSFIGQLTKGCQEALRTAIPELAESEDERIRKELLDYIKYNKEHTPETTPGEHWDRWIAYLEKQKEQKPFMCDGEIEDKKRDIVAAIRKHYPADYAEYLTSFLKGLSPEDNSEDEYGQKMLGIAYKLMYEHIPENLRTQEFWDSLKFMREYTGKVAIIHSYEQPAEWSEEDEEICRIIINRLTKFDEWASKQGYRDDPGLRRNPKDWLKSLRPQPHWKPSEEQMAVLEIACKYEGVFTQGQLSMLLDLKEQLKKL